MGGRASGLGQQMWRSRADRMSTAEVEGRQVSATAWRMVFSVVYRGPGSGPAKKRKEGEVCRKERNWKLL